VLHAGLSFAFDHPEDARQWHNSTPWVVVLGVPDEAHLISAFQRTIACPHRVLVREPDLDNAATAFAALGHEAARVLSDLPLALKEHVMI
jgi:hypothetical protein